MHRDIDTSVVQLARDLSNRSSMHRMWHGHARAGR